MIDHYYECNHGLVAVIDGRTYLLTEDIIRKFAIRPKFGPRDDDDEYSESYDDDVYVEYFCDD